MPNAKRREKLTKTLLGQLEPADTEYSVWDTEVDGFFVRVSPAGRKSFVVFYRNGRRQRKRTVGSFPTVSVADARAHARQLITASKRGEDPFGEQDRKLNAQTMNEFWDVYWKTHCQLKKASTSQKEDQRLWNKHLAPKLGRFRVDEVQYSDVSSLHASMSDTPYIANRVHSLLSKMFSLAIRHGLRTDNPCKGIERFPEPPRERILTPDEFSRLVQAIEAEKKRDEGSVTALMLLVLTGARRGEALQARWEEFDLSAHTWTVPREHIKGGVRCNISISRHLSETTVELLTDWCERCPTPDGFVFPSPVDPSKPRENIRRAWDNIRARAGLSDFRAHDLRHNFGTLAFADGHSLEAIGKNMGHRSPVTTRRYAHVLAASSDAVSGSIVKALQAARGN